MADDITVSKLDIHGRETWRYSGKVLERGEAFIQLEALFDRDDAVFHGITLQRGDRFVEIFYSDRWYNIFEIYDRDKNLLKGWYCNIGLPAEIEDSRVSYRDLALDLLVHPDGTQFVLDEDEFAILPLDEDQRRQACQALDELQEHFARMLKSV